MKKLEQNKRREGGFSLIELMIVIAIIGLLIAIGIPAWNSMVRSGNQSAAIQTLQQVIKAQANYRNLKGDYGSFDDLIRDAEFNENFKGDKPVFNGYIYTLKLQKRASGTPPFYSVNADPESPTTGTRHFYVDSSKSTIKYNDEGEAGPDSPSLQGS